MNTMHLVVTILGLLALAFSLANASEPSPLEDFCNAIDCPKNRVFVNGKFCKDPKLVKPEDFLFSGLHIPGNTSNQVRAIVTPVNVDQLPGLNTFGVSLACTDYAPHGQKPLHTHPRATEVLLVLEGTLQVGFVTYYPKNKLYTKVVNKGDVFVFPVGLIHFQVNTGDTHAVAVSAYSSQNPGVITIANAVFGSYPLISLEILAKAFRLDVKMVSDLQAKFWMHSS